ncbi:MAG: hypothetical protein QNJ34_23225 [Xenococcaceae cyanobacterium MO_188.B29]|nr:hypothetical protein [Xenococcaceae cyanobacterium MO_188.B29]
MKKRIKLIPLLCCTIISVVGFNALNSSQALEKSGYKQTPTPTNPAPTNYWSSNGTRQTDTGRSASRQITTNSWNGNWRCRLDASGLLSMLTIYGNGGGSSISAYYPKAHGGQPARETYSIYNIDDYYASGGYEYRDANPREGPTGRVGVWTGNWSLNLEGTVGNPVIQLFREDHASGWRGTHTCTR